jgi:hypothetical protein
MNLSNIVLSSLRRLAQVGLAALLLVLPIPAGEGGDGGWINLPGNIGGGGTGGSGSGRQIVVAPTNARLVVTGEAARTVLGGRPGNAAGIEPPFRIAMRASALLRGDQAFVEVGQRFVGGLGVMQVAGLPPVPFELTGDQIDLPIRVFQTLAAAGHSHVTLRLLTPELDRLVIMTFELTQLCDVIEPMLMAVGEVR